MKGVSINSIDIKIVKSFNLSNSSVGILSHLFNRTILIRAHSIHCNSINHHLILE